jgi:hypothetical protein
MVDEPRFIGKIAADPSTSSGIDHDPGRVDGDPVRSWNVADPNG